MMPVVDAGVGLSQNCYSTNDYLSEMNQFHLLRMVAVQQQRSAKEPLQELNDFQVQATTKGYGGFPNAIVASVDLFDSQSLSNLISQFTFSNLRGVIHRFGHLDKVVERAEWERSLEILVRNNLCLDLSATPGNDALIVNMAQYQPSLNIIVTMLGAENGKLQSAQLLAQWRKRLTPMVRYSNICLKICNASVFTVHGAVSLTALIDEALTLFGEERIMFASGVSARNSNLSVDCIWSQYDKACSNLSAQCRNSLFRMNATRVYGL